MGITYPSGHATDTVGFSAPARAESLRDPACTDLNRVYINLDSPKSMVEDHKKNESESKSEEMKHVNLIYDMINMLTERIANLEEHLRSLDHGNEGGNDIRDGGWFD